MNLVRRYWHFSLPIILPFLILALVRLVWFAAGAGWSDPGLAALLSLVSGTLFGVALSTLIEDAQMAARNRALIMGRE